MPAELRGKLSIAEGAPRCDAARGFIDAAMKGRHPIEIEQEARKTDDAAARQVVTAPASGELVAALMTGRAPAIDPAPYRPGRLMETA